MGSLPQRAAPCGGPVFADGHPAKPHARIRLCHALPEPRSAVVSTAGERQNELENGLNHLPHPGLLPKEKENHAPSSRQTRDWIGRTINRKNGNVRRLFLLLGGE